MKFLLLLLFSFQAHSQISSIYSTHERSCISLDLLKSQTQDTEIFILGEFHNDDSIQNAQNQIINELKNQTSSVMWEFLNHHDQSQISEAIKSLSATEFINTFPGKHNTSYLPLIKTVQENKLELIGLNISRAYKQKIIKEGIQSVPQEILPYKLIKGSPDYRTRFTQVMGNHIPPEMLEKYFLAQYLTDSIMAQKIIENHFDRSFVIAGSFHTDFFDGTVYALKELSNITFSTFKFINQKTLTTEEIHFFKNGDPEFGLFADYIVFSL